MKAKPSYEFIESGRGGGMPLVMLHGVVGCMHNWQGIFPFLPDDSRGIALKFPFFDEAAVGSVNDAVDHVISFLDSLESENVVLMGNSFGGHVAIHVALRRPERIAGLVLAGSGGLLERGFGAPPSARPDREWIRRATSSVFHDESHVTEEMIDDICQTMGCRSRVRRLVGIFRSTRRERLDQRLGEITCPVQLIWGRQDRITPPHTALEFQALLPDNELSWIDGCGHAPMMEAPRQFGGLLRQWWMRRISGQRLQSPAAGKGIVLNSL